MSEPRKHHFLPRFLLRGFAVPESDSGRLFVLDNARKKVFASSPASCAYRRDYNRLEPSAHPNALVVEEFYAKAEGRAAPVINQIRTTQEVPSRQEVERLLDLIAIQYTRTPGFRKWLEGKYLEVMERQILKMGRHKAARRRFARKQRECGVPEDCLTPEGFLARLKSGEFSVTTDDNWKIGFSLKMLPILARVLKARRWSVARFSSTLEPLILPDTGVSYLSVAHSGLQIVGVALPTTVVYLPVSSRLALFGTYFPAGNLTRRDLEPQMLNTHSFAWCNEQCYSAVKDFIIDDPDRGPTKWTTFQQEGHFPKLAMGARDLAEEYSGQVDIE